MRLLDEALPTLVTKKKEKPVVNFETRPLVYVAGPYSHPDPVENTHKALAVGDRLNASERLIAYVPHMSLLWHLVHPHKETYWYDYDLHLLQRCDALFRMHGISVGSDNEVKFAKERGIPVFRSEENLMEWAYKWEG